MAQNGIVELRRFLGTNEKPVDAQEMVDFWNSLTDEEKAEFKETELF